MNTGGGCAVIAYLYISYTGFHTGMKSGTADAEVVAVRGC